MKITEFLQKVIDFLHYDSHQVRFQLCNDGSGSVMDSDLEVINLEGVYLSWVSLRHMNEVLTKAIKAMNKEPELIEFEL